MLIDTVNEMLEMAEWFKANGYREEYRNLKDTANKILDYIYFTAQQRGAPEIAEIARPEKRSGVQRGALKPNGQH